MKKVKSVVIAIVIILILILISIVLYNKMQPENMRVKMKAVVVKVNENSMLVMEYDKSLMNIGFSEDGNIGYQQGQEIEIYYDGIIDSIYPGHIGKPGKIKVTKEESNIEIPESILRYAYSSIDNVHVEITELTNEGITLQITDTNELKYLFANSYKIEKEEKNLNYTGASGYKIGEDTETSTAGFTGTGAEYIWEEIDKISDILYEDTEEVKRNTSKNLIDRKFNWTELYGKLESGEYKFDLFDEDCLGITIEFAIDENGNISYNEPQILY